jgi:DNA-binding PadR family transcriptional regulator
MIKVDNLLKLHVLISLNNGEKHGYEIMKELSKKLNKKISASHVYPFLKQLKESYYVKLRKLGKEKIYTLTDIGKKFVDETLLKFNEIIHESLKRKITKCTHCSCEIYNNKYNEIINGKKLSFCCLHCAEYYKKRINKL